MKFTMWRPEDRARGPEHAMIATIRVEVRLTPADVAHQLLYSGTFEGDGIVEGDTPDAVRNWIAGLPAAEVTRLVKWAVLDMGASDYIYMYVGERFSTEAVGAATQAVLDRFVDDETVARLFGGAA